MRLVLLALLCLASCGGEKSPAPVPEPIREPPVVPEPVPAEPSPFPAGTLSLKLRRTVGVRLEPFEAAKRIGTIAIDTRVGWTRTSPGDGCASVWVQIRPRGWVCADHLEPSPRLPLGVELPRLERGEIVPGTYGKVVDQGATTMMLKRPAKAPGKAAAKAGKPVSAPVTSPRQLGGEKGDPEDAGKLVPGKPVIGSVNVRQYKELVVDGRLYWKISPTENEYLAAISIHKHQPSQYQGSRLSDDTGLFVPFAFIWPRAGAPTAWTRETARIGNKRQLPRRMVVSLHEAAYLPVPAGVPPRAAPAGAPAGPAPGAAVPAGAAAAPAVASAPGAIASTGTAAAPSAAAAPGVAVSPSSSPPAVPPAAPAPRPFAYRIGPAEWIDATSVRPFTPAPPPAFLQPGERWIDVDLDAQILVAYEGTLPVYATLISAGARLTPTETGVYRMWKKMAETDMNGLTGEDPYSVATVPWTQFYSPENGLALHTAYWHDGFGTPRSHGCINLAPADARWLYFWSDPQVPPGWTMAAGVSEAPGSLVRVRNKANPDPPLRGYAKRVEEQRASNEPD